MGIAITDDKVLTDRMSGADFHAFYARRPERERWELIAGVPMMMPPPTFRHNRIADNLVRLLNDALDQKNIARVAAQRPGIEVGLSERYRPEPDVAVIDADYEQEQRYTDRCYLLAEIVSSSDDVQFPDMKKPWIEVKRELYRAHPPCEAVLIVQQNRIEVSVDVRTAAGWNSETLQGADAPLALPSFGLHCLVSDLYRGTPLLPRVGR